MHTIKDLKTKTLESKLHQHVGKLSKLITDGADAYNMTIADYLEHIVVEGKPAEQCEQLRGCTYQLPMPRESYWTSITAYPRNTFRSTLMSFATS